MGQRSRPSESFRRRSLDTGAHDLIEDLRCIAHVSRTNLAEELFTVRLLPAFRGPQIDSTQKLLAKHSASAVFELSYEFLDEIVGSIPGLPLFLGVSHKKAQDEESTRYSSADPPEAHPSRQAPTEPKGHLLVEAKVPAVTGQNGLGSGVSGTEKI